MTCAKCGCKPVALYGVPGAGLGVQWCYDCWVQDYGTDEDLAEWIEQNKDIHAQAMELDRAIEASAFPNK